MVLAACAVVADFPVFFSMRDGPVGTVGSRGSHEDGQHDEGGSDADRHPVGAHGNGCGVCGAIGVTLHLFHLDEVGRVCGVQTQPDGALRTVNDLGVRVCWATVLAGEASV